MHFLLFMRKLTTLIAGAIVTGSLGYLGMKYSSETMQTGQVSFQPVSLIPKEKQLENDFYYNTDWTERSGRYGSLSKFPIKNIADDQPIQSFSFDTLEVYSPLEVKVHK